MDRTLEHRRRWRRRAGRIGATALSAGAHAGLAIALLLAWRTTPGPADQPALAVSLAPPPLAPPKPPAPTPTKKAAAHVAPAHAAAAPRLAARPSPAPPVADPLPTAPEKSAANGEGDELTGAQLAGAASADDGGGGECDMARRVQAALRKDPLVRAAVHATSGQAIMVWNGDWVQSNAEDGKGLAAVREAITWEVAFAPPACRHEHVRGLVLLSLADGSARLAVGAGDWRWSDLLGLR
jgi:hypothetical protein